MQVYFFQDIFYNFIYLIYKERGLLMGTELKKKYGLVTAICMVVGIVIGSGVFFKAQDVLNHTKGNMPLGILAWIIGGIVIIACSYNFATLANKYEKVNGLVDYAEATLGHKYAYMLGWFTTTIYYPGMTSVLAWVSARFTHVLIFGYEDPASGFCLALSCLYLCLSYAINTLSPVIAGKFQVGSTAVKLVPLIIMAVVGTIVGFKNGNTVSAFQTWSLVEETGIGSPLFAAVVAVAFAYEGWIIATSINAELKNSKRNLPIALVVGSLVIVAVYILYYIGLAGGAEIAVLQKDGAPQAFKNIFGGFAGNALNAMIVVSCLGTLNGLMVASTRSLYALSARNQGPNVKMFKEVSSSTNMPTNASVFGLLVCAAWLFYFYGANLWTDPETGKNLFGLFSFDSSELPIITIYALYIPIFFMFMVKHGKESIFKNVIMPLIGIVASGFMIFAAVYAHGFTPYWKAQEKGEFAFPVLFYLIVFVVIMIIGLFFYKKNANEKE